MNFIEDAILPRSSDSLGKECNTAFKTSQGGSKTTFLPIKLQQSIIQAAMYACIYKFRRTLATMAIDKGMPIEQVQRLLGHVRIDTTLHYAIVNQNNVKLAHKKYLG